MRFGGEIQVAGAIGQVHLSACARPGVRGCWFWVAMAAMVLGVGLGGCAVWVWVLGSGND